MHGHSGLCGFSQRFPQLGHGLKAARRLLLKTPHDNAFQPRRGVQPARLLVQHCRHSRNSVLSLKCPPPAEHLVQHRPERENIGPRVGRFAFCLLRRHVSGGTEDGSRQSLSDRRSLRFRDLRQSKSRILTPRAVSRILAGFRSLWMIPFLCASSSAAAICKVIRSALPPAWAL